MPSWLVDDPSVFYLVLGLVALGLGTGWWMNRGKEDRTIWQGLMAGRLTRKQQYMVGLFLVGLLFVLVVVLSLSVVTEFKRIQWVIKDMSDGVAHQDIDRIFQHVSEEFHTQRGTTKSQFRPVVERYMKSGEIQKVKVWDFDAVEISREKGLAIIDFQVKGEGNLEREGQLGYRCRAVFVLEDDQWRVKTFDLFPPHIDPDSKEYIPLPY